MTKKHPLDGYDYTADVPPGTPLLVQDHSGQAWRLSRRGVRYHSDVRTLLHGARKARAPKEIAASARIRALLESTLGAGELPEGLSEPIHRWRDAPRHVGSMASKPDLAVYADGWVRACVPVYDDAPRTGARQLSARERKKLEADLAIAPQGQRLPTVAITERHVEVRPKSSTPEEMALAATIEGATPTRSRRVYAAEQGYAEAQTLPGARLLFEGGPVEVPEPGAGWRVPVTAWRAEDLRP